VSNPVIIVPAMNDWRPGITMASPRPFTALLNATCPEYWLTLTAKTVPIAAPLVDHSAEQGYLLREMLLTSESSLQRRVSQISRTIIEGCTDFLINYWKEIPISTLHNWSQIDEDERYRETKYLVCSAVKGKNIRKSYF
jgi:hypothetical protein